MCQQMTKHEENNSYNGFELISSLNFKGTPLYKYKSKNTGLNIAIAQVEGPVVELYITVATEASDNNVKNDKFSDI